MFRIIRLIRAIRIILVIMLTTILIFLIILGLLVFVHELGHFIAAKRSGMKVEEFGFGFPPRLAGIQKTGGKWKFVWFHKAPLDNDQTVYSINWIPLGGFVKITGENNEHEEDPRSFINRPFKSRFVTLIAGVTMNVVLALVLTSIGLAIGLPAAVDSSDQLPPYARLKDNHVAIIEVVPNYPADKAGIKPGDQVVKVDTKAFGNIDELRDYIKNNSGKLMEFQIKRGREILTLNVNSIKNPEAGQGPTGIALANVGKYSVPWYWAPIEGVKTVGIQIFNIVTGLYVLLTSKLGLSSLGGPIKIAQLTGEASQLGFVYLLQFTAFLSLNLAILNILPFPALDGGRILFLIIEKIRGKKNNQKIEQAVNTAGFLFLLLLMLAVTVKDIKGTGIISRIFGG